MLEYPQSYSLEHLQILRPLHRNQLQAGDTPELRHITDLVYVGRLEEMLTPRQHRLRLRRATTLGAKYLLGYCCLDLTSHFPLHDEFLPEMLELSGANCVPTLEAQYISRRVCEIEDISTHIATAT